MLLYMLPENQTVLIDPIPLKCVFSKFYDVCALNASFQTGNLLNAVYGLS